MLEGAASSTLHRSSINICALTCLATSVPTASSSSPVGIDRLSRELATVGAQAATPGVEPQMRSHMAASMRVELTVEQLHQVIEVLAEHGRADAARRASEALTRASATMQEKAK